MSSWTVKRYRQSNDGQQVLSVKEKKCLNVLLFKIFLSNYAIVTKSFKLESFVL